MEFLLSLFWWGVIWWAFVLGLCGVITLADGAELRAQARRFDRQRGRDRAAP